MSTADDAIDWRKLREFAGVELTKSFILSWHSSGSTLSIDVDLLLTEEHAFYEKPRPAEKVCVRPAIIEFPYCEKIDVDGMTLDEPVSEKISILRSGAIEGLKRIHEGPFEISGVFGTVRIDSERPIIRMRNS